MTAELPGFQQVTADRNLFKASELPRTRSASRVAIATLFALVVASCGSGDDAEEEGGPNPPPPPPAMAELTVTITGQGEVMTPDQTLMCDSSCVFEVEQGKSVTLNAVPAADYDFSLWQGDCSSSLDTPICSLDVDTDKNVLAGFTQSVSGNNPPQAAITGDSAGLVNTVLQLSGEQSSDPDGDPLTYQWTVVNTPTQANATLGSPTEMRTTFQGDTPGIYVFSLVVNDGQASSEAVTFAIGLSVDAPGNTPPVAAITGDASGETQALLRLSGAQSSDADGDALTYQWSVLSMPTLATAVLGSPTQVETTFQGATAGTYVVGLIVHDGQESSPLAMFVITLSAASGNTPPVAVITGDASGETEEVLQLSGSGSSDADGDPLTYQWSVQSAPVSANAVLGVPTQAQTSFTGDLAGDYVIELVVNDGQESSPSATFVITLSAASDNTPPVAVITGDASGETEEVLQLSGLDSSDADGDPLTYQWSVQSAPASANAVLGAPTQAQTSFTGDLAGDYVIELVVNDGQEASEPDTHIIQLTEAVNAGTIDISPDNFDPGTVLQVTVTDVDLNIDAEVVESVVIQVTNQSSSESELVTLIETSPDSDRFDGEIVTVAGGLILDNDGQLVVADGDLVRAEYTDDSPPAVIADHVRAGIGNAVDELAPGHWLEIPNSQLELLDPGDDSELNPNWPGIAPWHGMGGLPAIMGAWGSGAFDSQRGRLAIWGGGHGDYAGNEVYVFDVETLAWERPTAPSVDVSVTGTTLYVDGEPRARETYNYLEYVPAIDRLVSFGGGNLYPGANVTTELAAFNFDTSSWDTTSLMPHPGAGFLMYGTMVAIDKLTGHAWLAQPGFNPVFEYDPGSNTWTSHSSVDTLQYRNAAIDQRNRYLVWTGQHGNTFGFDLDNPSEAAYARPITGDTEIQLHQFPGMDWDPVSERIIAWMGGAEVYALNTDAAVWEWTRIDPDPGNDVIPTTPNVRGTHGRFRYVPQKDAFILVNQVGDNVFFYKLPLSEERSVSRGCGRMTAVGKSENTLDDDNTANVVICDAAGDDSE